MEKGRSRRVGVVGAGPSGLVAAKELLENGVEVVVFEKVGAVGGVWNPATGCVWHSMHTNISKFSTTFGDFQWAEDVEMFPSVGGVFEYLNAYVDKFGIREKIKFNCQVEEVTFLENSKWRITWKSKDGQALEDFFDAVVVATGIFDVPSIPADVPGLTMFPGKVLHSREYRNGNDFENLKVLVIGGSFSGVEIAADLAKYTEKTFHVFRKPFWILRRYLEANETGGRIPIDLLWHKRSIYYAKVDGDERDEVPDPLEARITRNKRLQKFCEAQQEVKELKVAGEDLEDWVNVVISDDYVRQVKEDQLVPLRVGGVKEVIKDSVILEDGKEIQVDVILWATGFKPNIGFLGEKVLEKIRYDPEDRIQPVILCHEMIHPEVHGLFFVGLYKGPDFAVMEQQARYAARIVAGKAQLPSKEEMEKGLKVEEEIRNRLPRPQFPHPDYVRLADTLAKLSGSFPDTEKLLDDSFSLKEAFHGKTDVPGTLEMKKQEIGKQFWNSPVVPAHYNLVDNPKATVNHMDLVDQIVKQFLQD